MQDSSLGDLAELTKSTTVINANTIQLDWLCFTQGPELPGPLRESMVIFPQAARTCVAYQNILIAESTHSDRTRLEPRDLVNFKGYDPVRRLLVRVLVWACVAPA